MRFRDRRDAGRELAERLVHLRYQRPVVVGLPRGGVVVARQVAAGLGAPLDVVVVRRVAAARDPDAPVGAVGEGGVYVLNHDLLRQLRVSTAEVARAALRERSEVDRRAALFRSGRPGLDLRGRTVIVVDDGIVTGASVSTALRVVRAMGAHRVVLAVPVAATGVLELLAEEADEVVCLRAPRQVGSVAAWYREFGAVGDQRVVELLAQQPPPPGGGAETSRRPAVDERVEVPAGGHLRLPGHLAVPAGATGLVIFAHGSGSSRHSPRHRRLAAELHAAGLGTLLLDLLHASEEAAGQPVFDVPLLAARLAAATDLVSADGRLDDPPIGYFGFGTGAAAALWAAGRPDPRVRAVVCRGGRLDLADEHLDRVAAPTLLVVGGHDEPGLRRNRAGQRLLRCPNELVVVPGSGALFAEQGALDRVAELAAEWFLAHLPATAAVS
ncbi:phosphoribosyltransferase family protein [Gandjariella thermophila]|uniref:Putative phosphoribosyl transferase n=1 Tax=Gandjariella thermophila TaxID=1931992 RepID=A0A4D4IXE7_9PSEU|nr:phosphoribosyltransferase family protein [Gandjariella thermophila]GDY29045.1 putative phosphoribosyl transferase [Gandjariella thermophila]